jgi:hypothetical protein
MELLRTLHESLEEQDNLSKGQQLESVKGHHRTINNKQTPTFIQILDTKATDLTLQPSILDIDNTISHVT